MKTSFRIIVCLFVMFLIFTGCSHASDDFKNSHAELNVDFQTTEQTAFTEGLHESDDLEHNHVELITEVQTVEEVAPCLFGSRFGFANPDDNADIKSELIDYIAKYNSLMSSSVEATDANIQETDLDEFLEQTYIDNNISEIESFYFPMIAIEGFKLYRAIIDEWSFLYYYAPVEKLKTDKEYKFEFNDGILLSFSRPHWIDSEDPLGAEINKMINQDRPYELRNNLLYKADTHRIMGAIGGTRFTFHPTDALSDPEYLFSIGEAIIQTSELVIIK